MYCKECQTFYWSYTSTFKPKLRARLKLAMVVSQVVRLLRPS